MTMRKGSFIGALVVLTAMVLPTSAAATPSGSNGRVAFDRYSCDAAGTLCSQQIYAVNPNGSTVVKLSQSFNYSDSYPAWTSSGKILFQRCCVAGLSQVFRMDGDGANQTQVSNGNFNDYEPSASLTGSIAFVHASNIWSMNSDGSNRTQLTTDGADDSWPVWSPAGTKIAYVRDYYSYPSYTTQIVVMNSDGSNPGVIWSVGHYAYPRIDWSPDGSTIGLTDQGTLETIPATGGSLTAVRDSVDSFAFSPDGAKFTFGSNGDVWDETLGGTSATDLASGADPAWGSFVCSGSGCGSGSGGQPGTLQAQFITPSRLTAATSPTVPYSMKWTVGTCAPGSTYTLAEAVDGGSMSSAFSGTATSTTLSLLPGHSYTFQVDCGGPASAVTFGLHGSQQSGATYTGTWAPTTFTGAWGGTARYSTAKGASATFRCTCEAFTWVTDEDTSHGSAKVYVDGVLKKTINTQASTKKDRLIVYKYGWPADGSHTLKIVNRATSGHPRLTVDGFLTRTAS